MKNEKKDKPVAEKLPVKNVWSVAVPEAKTILIVDDSEPNRMLLSKLLAENYTILTAENGRQGLDLLAAHAEGIIAVLLDITMPVMDGYGFLKCVRTDTRYHDLPIIVTTDDREIETEIKALSLGAWDFISKPYSREILQLRLSNAIQRSHSSAFSQLKYLAEYDELTGIYNKKKFFAVTRAMLDFNGEKSFALLRLDIDRFQLINSFFGIEEGDRLLCYIAAFLSEHAKTIDAASFGRMESDIFCLCVPSDKKAIGQLLHQIKYALALYNINYDIVPSVGIYYITERAFSIESMYNCATLAAKTCKGSYMSYYAVYNESMSMALRLEQEITNEMSAALEGGQFEIYLQPKYNIQLEKLSGAEALVRWNHPEKGMRPPSEFIPIFERNGFITKLDFFVWEQTCKYLRQWMDEGKTPYPISVNVSRVNMYNPNLEEVLLQLIEKYRIPAELLQLELTESAYTDNPIAVSETTAQLQSKGFVILMDDFGSGYSSLNILKDIAVDMLKIDMRFLSETKIPGRGENIVASVVRMAKWLSIPVVTEGVETGEQMEFLRSVGCDYIQGYYYARPMPVANYVALCNEQPFGMQAKPEPEDIRYSYDDLFAISPDVGSLMESTQQAAAIYEFSDEQIELIRVNSVYYTMLGQRDMAAGSLSMLNTVDEEYRGTVQDAFRACVKTKQPMECEYLRKSGDGHPLWLYTRLCYLSKVAGKHILWATLSDVTLKKEIDRELQEYRAELLNHRDDTHTILIADDVATNRIILRKFFEHDFKVLEADNGASALAILEEKGNEIDLILLDLVMPVMDGRTFLIEKKKTPAFDAIPVIVITADDTPEQQVDLLALGTNDYITKPFIPEIVGRRVQNVLGFNHRFKEMAREYGTMTRRVKINQMTGIFNRTSVEEAIEYRLKNINGLCAMMMLDIDDFKKINDTYGHTVGDKAICAVAQKLKTLFRQTDVVGRMGGDEFAVFIDSVPSVEVAREKAWALCTAIDSITIEDTDAIVTCSVGLFVSAGNDTFETMYQNSDKALYAAKHRGKNNVAVFGHEAEEKGMLPRWIGDSEGVLNDILEAVYVSNNETYELLYINDYACKMVGCDKHKCLGKKCYEVLMGKKTPCEFCTRHKMTETKTYCRYFHMPNSDTTYLMRGKRTNWNGVVAHLEIATDVTHLKMLDDEPRNAPKDGDKEK